MIKLCVFDCDGTLVDSQRSITRAMEEAFEAHGLGPPAAEHVRRLVGLPLLDAIADLLPADDGIVHETVRETYVDIFAAWRRDGAVDEPLYPGVIDSLNAIEEAGWLLGVATGKARRGLVNTLATHGLEDRFVTLQTSDVALGKPNPDMLLRAMDETGAVPQATVMIGDTTFDMLMARNAGTGALGVAWGYHDTGDLDAAGAHAVVPSAAELPQAVAALVDAERP